ncbi:unnamed protein product [Bursaphelenchus okinawaensis]|uniref:Uncharacterized protein n=1 Tax=Bursaphelenchus okinawaensis TaxID=465554 RepID=A0A811L9R8_9BILA|nr:unnamed protein product [Bursaphelenchus okinawaensis]CAG9120431.1 unnamed protein product [Bursaphelenchus okinawaensis]
MRYLFGFICLFTLPEVMARRKKCPEGSWSEGRIVNELMGNYTKMLPDTDGSVGVNIEMHVQDMGSLNEISADFQIDILFTQLWHDSSLSFTNHSQCIRNITMETRYLHKIWTPNTCIINSKATTVHKSPTENIFFILYDNGTVWTNHRLSVKAPCALDLRTFPFDTQTCTLLFESYSHNNEEVSLHWMDEPITLMKVIQLPDFDMVQYDTRTEKFYYPNGNWDQLQAVFTFKRRYGFYILQAYVPTYLTIIVSWVSFCMEPKALPARTTVGVSSLLAITMMFGNILKNLPRVSYVKAMDVWMLGCISFVFGTMVELAFVCYITRCQAGHKKTDPPQHAPYHSVSSSSSSIVNGMTSTPMGAFGCLPSREHQIGSLRYRPYANGVCGNGRTEANRAVLLSHDTRNRRSSHALPTNGSATHFRQSPSPPPSSRLLRPGSPTSSAHNLEMNSMFTPAGPLTFEQINGYQPQPMYLRTVARRRHLLNIQPESIDKMSIVCFPLAFTFFNLIYWWYYLSQSFEGLPPPQPG